MKQPTKPLVSISVPVLNEEENINPFILSVREILIRLSDKYTFEIVFSDNNSSDRTWSMVSGIVIPGVEVHGIRFTRNVGFQNSILANFEHCRGDAIIQIDVDLQDPPELIEEFLTYWSQGYRVVYGIREQRNEGFFWTTYRRFGYSILNKLADFELPQQAGDFRLIDRLVADQLLKQTHLEPFLRGAIAKMGYREKGIKFERRTRKFGESKFNVRSVLKLGLTGVLSYSTFPLRIASYVGVLVIILALVGSIYYIWAKLGQADVPVGFTTTQVLILFGLGMNAFFLGVIGEYISRIFRVIMREPRFIIADKF